MNRKSIAADSAGQQSLPGKTPRHRRVGAGAGFSARIQDSFIAEIVGHHISFRFRQTLLYVPQELFIILQQLDSGNALSVILQLQLAIVNQSNSSHIVTPSLDRHAFAAAAVIFIQNPFDE